jgi:Crinkler effector protein N-terminal domain
MALVSLNCLVYGDEPPFSHIFDVKVLLEERISDVRDKIWAETDQHVPAKNFILYTPTEAISTAKKATFNEVIAQLSLESEEGLEELNPTSHVKEYGKLAKPGQKVLHVIVVVPIGGYFVYTPEVLFHWVDSSAFFNWKTFTRRGVKSF